MQLLVNGQIRQFENVSTVADLLVSLSLQGKRLAVERNGEVVPRSLHAETRLVERDAMEIVVAVGGG